MSRIRFEILPPIDRPGEPVFLTGNIAALGNWQAEHGLRLAWNPPFHTGEIEAETGTHLEYKIVRGSWEKEAVDAWGNVPENLTHDVWLDGTRHHTVADWKDRYRGRLTREASRQVVRRPREQLACGCSHDGRFGSFQMM